MKIQCSYCTMKWLSTCQTPHFALRSRSVTAIVKSGHRQSQEARRPTNYQFIEEKGAISGLTHLYSLLASLLFPPKNSHFLSPCGSQSWVSFIKCTMVKKLT